MLSKRKSLVRTWNWEIYEVTMADSTSISQASARPNCCNFGDCHDVCLKFSEYFFNENLKIKRKNSTSYVR
jgi:hypothetical protein